MKNEKTVQDEIVFPVGYHTFNKNKDINFQLNRLFTFGFLNQEDVAAAGQRIKTNEDWQTVWTELAADFLSRNRPLAAAFSYRAAELYALPDDPKKFQYYDQFVDLYYGAVQIENLENRDRLAPRH